MGNIPSVSLVPGLDCGNCSKCLKGCYAMKAYRMYPATRDAYHRNSDMAHNDRGSYFQQIADELVSNPTRFFRWHVAGDILDQDYLNRMVDMAVFFPGVRFLCFTKRFDIRFGRLPENLTIILSVWPGMPLPRNRTLPRAYMQDGTETRIPKGARECPGSCEDCKLCYGLKGSVVFNKH